MALSRCLALLSLSAVADGFWLICLSRPGSVDLLLALARGGWGGLGSLGALYEMGLYATVVEVRGGGAGRRGPARALSAWRCRELPFACRAFLQPTLLAAPPSPIPNAPSLPATPPSLHRSWASRPCSPCSSCSTPPPRRSSSPRSSLSSAKSCTAGAGAYAQSRRWPSRSQP